MADLHRFQVYMCYKSLSNSEPEDIVREREKKKKNYVTTVGCIIKMSKFIVCFVSLLLPIAIGAATFKIMSMSETDGFCPPREKRGVIIQNITASIRAILQEKYENSSNSSDHACGTGMWHRVAYLNMSDPSQQGFSIHEKQAGV